ncbi:hypothetical protein SAMN06265182_1230 [Persephonella hydrogeniphila]|uniref:Uncharacterized protein n=1 Tax=Persephonella hydrogeniphila TaxID=198703 RepID=A0A285NFG1_9AQUI|nr:hypothetical protein [Persephonella hydrogeniphila]SNZ08242.1 hypothetical protein SAMN06265182_1230 [Persephonella hydrogeniphila]
MKEVKYFKNLLSQLEKKKKIHLQKYTECKGNCGYYRKLEQRINGIKEILKLLEE